MFGEPLGADPGQPTDSAWLFYTSGTTGRPKGAVLTHRNLVFMSQCYYADIDQLDERDTHVLIARGNLDRGPGSDRVLSVRAGLVDDGG